MKSRYDIAVTLTRVLTSGVIMAIERNERELPALERLIGRLTGRRHVSLFNSSAGAIHGALRAAGVEAGSRAAVATLSEAESRLADWLRVELIESGTLPPTYRRVELNSDTVDPRRTLADCGEEPQLVIDFTGLGFGPAAAFATDDPRGWRRAERLKIFGKFDLHTMWTQVESAPDLEPTLQLNYRLSPLVAACIRTELARR